MPPKCKLVHQISLEVISCWSKFCTNNMIGQTLPWVSNVKQRGSQRWQFFNYQEWLICLSCNFWKVIYSCCCIRCWPGPKKLKILKYKNVYLKHSAQCITTCVEHICTNSKQCNMMLRFRALKAAGSEVKDKWQLRLIFSPHQRNSKSREWECSEARMCKLHYWIPSPDPSCPLSPSPQFIIALQSSTAK